MIPVSNLSPSDMNIITAQINGNEIQADIETIAELLIRVSKTITKPVTNTNFQDIEKFDDFVTAILKEYFSSEQSESIVRVLRQVSGERYPDYRGATSLYSMFVGTLEQRQLMKVVVATYSLKYCRNLERKSSLKSKIKYATACPHCGAYAAVIRDRLIKEGYLTV